MKIQTSIIGLSLAAFVMLSSGCSSSSDATVAPTIKKSGVAIDGEISGATVCVNGNENNTCDAGEDSTTTKIDGTFELVTNQTGPLLLVGGTDMGTGKAFAGTLKAPADSEVITPLTSMVAAMTDTDTTSAEAEATLKKALGIPASVELTTYNPFEKAEANDENAKAVLAAQAQIQTLVHASSATIAGADSSTEIVDVMDSVTQSLAKSLKASAVANPDSTVDISADMVAEATKEAATTVFAKNTTAQVAAKSSAESMAEYSVAQANVTKTTIEDGDLDSAVTNLNASMILANDTLEAKATETTASILDEIKDLDDSTLEALATTTDVNALLEESNVTPVVIEVSEDEIASALVEKKEDANTAAAEAEAQACSLAGGEMEGDSCVMPSIPTGSMS